MNLGLEAAKYRLLKISMIENAEDRAATLAKWFDFNIKELQGTHSLSKFVLGRAKPELVKQIRQQTDYEMTRKFADLIAKDGHIHKEQVPECNRFTGVMEDWAFHEERFNYSMFVLETRFT